MSNIKTVIFPDGDSVQVPYGPIWPGTEFVTQRGRTVRHHNVARKNADVHYVESNDGALAAFVNEYEFFSVVS